jgi:hypothetical protein
MIPSKVGIAAGDISTFRTIAFFPLLRFGFASLLGVFHEEKGDPATLALAYTKSRRSRGNSRNLETNMHDDISPFHRFTVRLQGRT